MTDSGSVGTAWLACVDAGNSRTKLYRAEYHRPQPVAGDAGEERVPVVSLLDAWEGHHVARRSGPAPSACVVSSVASQEDTKGLAGELASAWGDPVPVIVQPDCGLELRTEHSETVGRDRLFAARGALARVGGSCVVVDAGTALTVDALSVQDGVGAFLGGAIAPGPELLAASLLRGGARLQKVVPTPGARALGRHTQEALLSGVVVGFEGAAQRLVERVAQEAGLGAVPVVLCGGAAEFVHAALVETGREIHCEPALVAMGLAAAWFAN